jgi:L-cysteine S-thiosulfotransferase
MICAILLSVGLGASACAAPVIPFEQGVPRGDPASGRRLIAALACTSCHAIPGLPRPHGNVGPSLAGIGSRAFVAGMLPNRPAVLVRFVRDAPSLVPATGMPRMPLDDRQARDVAAFLATLR